MQSSWQAFSLPAKNEQGWLSHPKDDTLIQVSSGHHPIHSLCLPSRLSLRNCFASNPGHQVTTQHFLRPSNSFLFQIHVKGLGGWGWSWEWNDLPSVSYHPIYCTGYHFTCDVSRIAAIGVQYQHALFPQDQHSNPNYQNDHRWHCKGCLCVEPDVHHPEPGCRPLLWWYESYPEVGWPCHHHNQTDDMLWHDDYGYMLRKRFNNRCLISWKSTIDGWAPTWWLCAG